MTAIRFTALQKQLLECVCVASLFFIGAHFLYERISHRELPSGDEGSWLSVAAQCSRGHGFSTHWLECQFQKPYTLPRPDDFRYPGLSLLLAGAFKVFGVSYSVALRTCALTFLCFCAAVFFCVRSAMGRATALLTLCATVFSLNLLQWNSIVYCEGLFGLVLTLLLILSITLDARKKSWWIALGACVGILTMVRPNGILVSAGLIGQYLWMRRGAAVPARYAAYGLLATAAVITPWCVRNMLFFANPFHIAGGAGLLQRSFNEPANESVIAFVKTAGILFPLKATMLGVPRFFGTLCTFEHGLCAPLLAFCAIGLLQRRRFFNAFAATGFAISFVMCCYAAYKSYAGVRYFLAFLPFVYAYGIASVAALIRNIPYVHRTGFAAYPGYALIGACFLAPVFYPHRYYERLYATHARSNADFSAHVSVLNLLLKNNGAYFAGRLGQLNFLTEYTCVGVQEDFDSAMVHRALATFKPVALALAPEEQSVPRFITFFDLLRQNHCIVTPKTSTSLGVYYSLEYPKKP